MNTLPVIPRELAQADVEQAIDHYLAEAGRDIAFSFIDALEAAYLQIATNPAACSPRWGHDLKLPGLRSQKLKQFPYLVFFMEREDYIDVWRILHAERDFAARLQDDEEESI